MIGFCIIFKGSTMKRLILTSLFFLVTLSWGNKNVVFDNKLIGKIKNINFLCNKLWEKGYRFEASRLYFSFMKNIYYKLPRNKQKAVD